MSDPDSDNEPTMEEILASIRKIISEDETEDAESRGAPEDQGDSLEPQSDEEPEPLELTRMVAEDGSVVDLHADQNLPEEPATESGPEPVGGLDSPLQDDEDVVIDLDTGDSDGVVEELPGDLPVPPPGGAPEHELVSAVTAAAAAVSISKLNEILETEAGRGASDPSGDSPEALVRETLSPHLKAWLDSHLPELVERIVREEIKKLVKRAENR